MDGLDGIDIEKFLNNVKKCDARIIITQLMEYGIPIDCPLEKWARKWLLENKERELDRNSGLI
jgi:hypothetical protein